MNPADITNQVETQLIKILPTSGSPVASGATATVQFTIPKGRYSCDS